MSGAESLGDAELLAVLLGTGCADEPVSVVATRLLESAGGLRNLFRLGLQEMSGQTGIGPGKACRISAALELGRRAAARPLDRGKRITCSRDVVDALGARLAGAVREHFWVIALDTKNRPLAEIEVAVGALSACALSPADVFRPVLREPCSSVVLVHNHPSGEPSPSAQDLALTRRLGRAGELMGIGVLDHVILADRGYFSFCDAGILRENEGRGPDPAT
jgi:DNA repair protein RadC